MKLSSKKKFFFTSVFITFIISTVIFLYTIKNNIRLFNNNFLNNYNNLFLSYLKKINLQNYENFMLHKESFMRENPLLDEKDIQSTFRRKLIPFNIKFLNEVSNGGFNDTNSETDNYPLFSFGKSKEQNAKDLNNKNYTKVLVPVDHDDYKDGENVKKTANSSNPISVLIGDMAAKGAFEIIDQNIFIFKHINFIYFAEKDLPDEKIRENKNKILTIIQELNKKLNDDSNKKVNFYIKIVYVNNEPSMQEYSDLYGDLNKLNSKYILDELYDEKYLNILIADLKPKEQTDSDSEKQLEIYYNEDIKNHIFCMDLESFLKKESKLNEKKAVDLFNVLISFKTLNADLTLKSVANKFGFEALKQILKLGNSNELKFYKMIAKIIFDLEKLNKFLANYESSRNIEMIKQKFQLIEKTLGEISKANFSPNQTNMQKINEIFVAVKFLMESSEMANYDHYFSFEFKIGMFLPVMVPVLYGLIKTVKALSF